MLTQVPSGMLQTTAQYYSMKNRIINGDFRVSQYNGANSVALSSSGYAIDRWNHSFNFGSQLTVGQNLNSITPPVGFSYYFGLQNSSSAYSIGSSTYGQLRQNIEGLNVSDLQWGTSNAKAVTISFWVYASVTGNYSLILQNYSNALTYATTYTITSANTWTYITITVPGPTSGSFPTTNAGCFLIDFNLGTGSSQSTSTTNSWFSGNYLNVTGTVQLVANANAVLYLTGVQLEVGTQATSFDYRPYGTELQLCQRYCYVLRAAGNNTYLWSVEGGSTTNVRGGFPLRQPMRVAPTVTFGTVSWFLTQSGGWGNSTSSAISLVAASTDNLLIDATASSINAGQGGVMLENAPTGSVLLIVNSEL